MDKLELHELYRQEHTKPPYPTDDAYERDWWEKEFNRKPSKKEISWTRVSYKVR